MSPVAIEILQALADGENCREIAERLGRAHQTVKNHVHIILNSLGADTIAQAVAMGIRRGLIK